jgi:hypothetical protein
MRHRKVALQCRLPLSAGKANEMIGFHRRADSDSGLMINLGCRGSSHQL